MVQSRVGFALRYTSGLIVLEFQYSEVDVAVGEVKTDGARAIDFGDFPHAEDFLVKLRGLLRILRGDCDMFDFCHILPPLVKPWELNTQEHNSSRRAKYRLKFVKAIG